MLMIRRDGESLGSLERWLSRVRMCNHKVWRSDARTQVTSRVLCPPATLTAREVEVGPLGLSGFQSSRKCKPQIQGKTPVSGVGEMVQWLRSFVALSEDPSLIPRTYIVVHNHP